jgi:hypothetical protein
VSLWNRRYFQDGNMGPEICSQLLKEHSQLTVFGPAPIMIARPKGGIVIGSQLGII